jgi:hypothetical protein
METPCARKFITAKLSIRKPGSSSVSSINKVSLISEVIELSSINKVYVRLSNEDPGLRIESIAVINLRGVSTNKTIICFIAMQTYKELNDHDFRKTALNREMLIYF